jgi:hypothetical protein
MVCVLCGGNFGPLSFLAKKMNPLRTTHISHHTGQQCNVLFTCYAELRLQTIVEDIEEEAFACIPA